MKESPTRRRSIFGFLIRCRPLLTDETEVYTMPSLPSGFGLTLLTSKGNVVAKDKLVKPEDRVVEGVGMATLKIEGELLSNLVD